MDGSGPGSPAKLPPYPRPKKPRSNPVGRRPVGVRASGASAGSHGDPVLEWRRPGGSATAVMGRGRKHT